MPRPDFICIGAQKAGTTWLHHQLDQHPDVWMPPVKELHFFNRPDVTRLVYRAGDRSVHGRIIRRQLKEMLRGEHSRWLFHFLLGRRDDEHYLGLFRPPAGERCGEITPGYARLEDESVARIRRLLPDTRIIYLLRSPVARAWSQVNMYRRQNGGGGEMPLADVLTVKGQELFKNSRYQAVLDRWERHYPAEQMLVGFFDRIKEDPDGLLRDIYGFLEIDGAANVLAPDRNRVRFGGSYAAMTLAEERVLTEALWDELVGLHGRFENRYTARWLARGHEVMSSTQATA